MKEVNHFRRFLLWYLATTIPLTLIVVLVLAPGMPPGNGTVQASAVVADNTVFLGVASVIFMAVLVYFVYSLIAFRERNPSVVTEGPAIRGHPQIQLWWIVVTMGIVLFLTAYGTIRLLEGGSGGGQGPNPIAVPSPPAGTKPLQVQVIAQQWQFTYRYPAYGGVETPSIEIPTNTLVEFHVTSLDVIHSFWAYQLNVKADANPGVDNIAFVQTKGPLFFNVRCSELCGLWHGYMFNSGRVVPRAQFASWIALQQRQFGAARRSLPPYTRQYFPTPLRRG